MSIQVKCVPSFMKTAGVEVLLPTDVDLDQFLPEDTQIGLRSPTANKIGVIGVSYLGASDIYT